MNYCPQGGYLVGGNLPLPTEPVDHDVVGLSRLGCNRLRCSECHAVVTSDFPTTGPRVYACRCRPWAQHCADSALDDP